MTWQCPSYSWECLEYWLHWHAVVEMSSLTVIKPKYELQYYQSWMCKHGGIQQWSCLGKTTDYENLPARGLRIQNTVITGHSSQLRMNGLSSSTWWRSQHHSNTGPCGCQKSIQSHCIMSSLSTMTCSIIWMVLCELRLGRWYIGKKTYTWPSRLRDSRRPNISLKSLQWLVCFSFQLISWIHSGSCDHLKCGTRRWISILGTTVLILPNTRMRLWSMWRRNNVPNIDEYPSLHPKIFRMAISSPLQTLLDLVNCILIHMICPAKMKNA